MQGTQAPRGWLQCQARGRSNCAFTAFAKTRINAPAAAFGSRPLPTRISGQNFCITGRGKNTAHFILTRHTRMCRLRSDAAMSINACVSDAYDDDSENSSDALISHSCKGDFQLDPIHLCIPKSSIKILLNKWI